MKYKVEDVLIFIFPNNGSDPDCVIYQFTKLDHTMSSQPTMIASAVSKFRYNDELYAFENEIDEWFEDYCLDMISLGKDFEVWNL